MIWHEKAEKNHVFPWQSNNDSIEHNVKHTLIVSALYNNVITHHVMNKLLNGIVITGVNLVKVYG